VRRFGLGDMDKRLRNRRYEIGERLGAGSMAEVFRCQDLENPQRELAVKILFPEVAKDPRGATRLRHDFDALTKIDTPYVVKPFEFISDGHAVAYTMELASEGNLSYRIQDSRSLSIVDAVTIAVQVCNGIQVTHDAGITHRNIKPENILLFGDGAVKIADFCISCRKDGSSVVSDEGAVGTMDFVPPEYLQNGEVNWLTDIYGIGLLTYELITGQSPFRGETVFATMTQRLHSSPKPPSSLRNNCPERLDAVVLRALNKDPRVRFQSASEMADALLDSLVIS